MIPRCHPPLTHRPHTSTLKAHFTYWLPPAIYQTHSLSEAILATIVIVDPSSGLLFVHALYVSRAKDPLGSNIRCERGSSLSASLSPHLVLFDGGCGATFSLQFKVAGSPFETIRSGRGCSTMRGGKSSWSKTEPAEELTNSFISSTWKQWKSYFKAQALALPSNKHCIVLTYSS